jgi:hypothetical protein
MANLLALPGSGTVMAGRRVTGTLQVLAALAGFALTMWWARSFASAWLATGHFPSDGGPHLRVGLAGGAVFAVAWFWALATGLAILRAAHGNKPPAGPTP